MFEGAWKALETVVESAIVIVGLPGVIILGITAAAIGGILAFGLGRKVWNAVK